MFVILPSLNIRYTKQIFHCDRWLQLQDKMIKCWGNVLKPDTDGRIEDVADPGLAKFELVSSLIKSQNHEKCRKPRGGSDIPFVNYLPLPPLQTKREKAGIQSHLVECSGRCTFTAVLYVAHRIERIYTKRAAP